MALAVDSHRTRTTDEHVQAMRADDEFRVGVAHEEGGIRVCPIGEVDLATIGRLRERMSEAMAAGGPRLILDLRGTTFLDSAGLHLALDTNARAMGNGTEFVIIAGPPVVQRAFVAAGLSERLPFVRDGALSQHAPASIAAKRITR